MRVRGPNSLGQHTISDPAIIERIVHEANLAKTERVLEIGTGQGGLTLQLCRNARHVISVEIDRSKYENTKHRLQDCTNLKLLNTDLFNSEPMNFEFDVCVSNIPYSRSKDTILWLSNHKFNRALILVQKEFAKKLSSPPGTRAYRAISVIGRYCFDIIELFDVPSYAFTPRPAVSSEVIRLVPTGRRLTDELKKNIELIFSRRRKKISKFASSMNFQFSHDTSKRVDQLSPQEIVDMAQGMKKHDLF